MASRLGDAGAPKHAAQEMIRCYTCIIVVGAKGVEELHNESLFVSKGYKIVKRDKAGAVNARLSYFIVRIHERL